MKNKKGFTLIELLIAVVIMLSVLGLAIVAVSKLSEKQKQNYYKRVQEQTETAAHQFFSSNEYLFEKIDSDNKVARISVGKLVDEGYLNVLTNPTNGKKLNRCDMVEVSKTGNKYSFKYGDKTDDAKDDPTMDCYASNFLAFSVVDSDAPEITVVPYDEDDNVINDTTNGYYNSRFHHLKISATSKTSSIKEIGNCKTVGNEMCKEKTNKKEEGAYYIEPYCSSEPTAGVGSNDCTNDDFKTRDNWFYAIDDNGKPNEVVYEFGVDRKSPLISYENRFGCLTTTNINNTNCYGKISEKFEISDEISGIATCGDNCKSKDASNNYFEINETFSVNNKEITISANDKAGNSISTTLYANIVTPPKPTCTIRPSGTKGNENWYTGNVNLTLNTTDYPTTKGLSTTQNSTNGLTSGTQSSDTVETTWYGYVENSYGSDTCSTTIKKDSVVPEITYDDSRVTVTAGAATASTSSFDVLFRFSDTTSGIDLTSCTGCTKQADGSYTKSITFTDNSAKTISVKDNAGNTKSITLYANIGQAPTCTITSSDTLGANDWYTSERVNLSLETSGTITRKGLATVQGSVNNSNSAIQTGDTKGTMWYGYVENSYGSSTCSKTIKKDSVDPEITYVDSRVNGTAGTATSSTTSFSVSFKFSDTTSGIDSSSCEDCTKYADGSYTKSITFTDNSAKTISVKDNAGNTKSITLYANIGQAPSCNIVARGTKKNSSSDWYTGNVSLVLNINGTTTSKGLSTSQNSTNELTSGTQSSNTTGTTWYGYVENSYGSSTCSKTIKKDSVAPEITYVDSRVNGTAGTATSSTTSFSVSFKFSDTTSGIDPTSCSGCTEQADGSYTKSITFTNNGAKTISVKDNAGNTKSITLYANIGQAPTCTISASGTKGKNNWYTSNVDLTLNINGTATAKGLSITQNYANGHTSRTQNADTTGTTWYGYVENSYGSNTCNITIKKDATKPTITPEYIKYGVFAYNNILGDYNGNWTNRDFYYNFIVTDNLKLVSAKRNLSGGGYGGTNKNLTISNNEAGYNTWIKEGHGEITLKIYAEDEAGNTEEYVTKFKRDEEKPTCSIKTTLGINTVKGNKIGDTQWFIKENSSGSDVSVDLALDGSDDMSGIDKTQGYIDETRISSEGTYVIMAIVYDKAGNEQKCHGYYGIENGVNLELDTVNTNNTTSFNIATYDSVDKTNYSALGPDVTEKYITNFISGIPNTSLGIPELKYFDTAAKGESSNGKQVFVTDNPNTCSYGNCNSSTIKCKVDSLGKQSCQDSTKGNYFARTCQRVSTFLNYFSVSGESIGTDMQRVTFDSNENNQKCYGTNTTTFGEATVRGNKYTDICEKSLGGTTEYGELKNSFGNGIDINPTGDYFRINSKKSGDLFYSSDLGEYNITNYKTVLNNSKIKITALSTYTKDNGHAYGDYYYGALDDKNVDFTAQEYQYVSPAGSVSNKITLFTEYIAKCGFLQPETHQIRQSYCANDVYDAIYWIKNKFGVTVNTANINTDFTINVTKNSKTYTIDRKACTIKQGSTTYNLK